MPTYREKAQQVASNLLNNPSVLLRMAGRAGARLGKFSSRVTAGNRRDIATLVRLVSAWAKGEYRDIPKSSLLAITGALVYFLMPLDAIPDPIVALGLLDDMAVIGYAIQYGKKDLDAFCDWEAERQSNPNAPPTNPQ